MEYITFEECSEFLIIYICVKIQSTINLGSLRYNDTIQVLYIYIYITFGYDGSIKRDIANVVAIPLDIGHLILDLQASVSVGNGTFTPLIIPYIPVVKALESSAETQK